MIFAHVDLLQTPDFTFTPFDGKGEDSVTAYSKGSTVENSNGKKSESVKVRNKKKEGEKADEIDGSTGQIVIAAKASTIQIKKVWLRLI